MEDFILKIKIEERYKKEVISIAITGLLLAITVVMTLVSGTYVPKIPLINGHIDFWYGFAILSVLLIPDFRYSIMFIIALPIVIMPTELASYSGGLDYFLELVIPVFALVIFVPLRAIKNIWVFIGSITLSIIIFSLFRMFMLTYAGVKIYGVTWGASWILNAPNAAFDTIAMIPTIAIPIIKLLHKEKSKSQ